MRRLTAKLAEFCRRRISNRGPNAALLPRVMSEDLNSCSTAEENSTWQLR